MATVEELATELAALRLRLEATEGVLAIHALKARYADLVDRRFCEGAPVDVATMDALATAAAELFTEDGVWDGGPALGRVTGRAAIAERLASDAHVLAPPLRQAGDHRRRRSRDGTVGPAQPVPDARGHLVLDVRLRGRRVRTDRVRLAACEHAAHHRLHGARGRWLDGRVRLSNGRPRPTSGWGRWSTGRAHPATGPKPPSLSSWALPYHRVPPGHRLSAVRTNEVSHPPCRATNRSTG